MIKSEKRIEQEIILKASELGAVLFKNNVGYYVTVASFSEVKTAVLSKNLAKATQAVKKADMKKVGLQTGSSDLIGIAPVKITQEMVGKTVGLFLSIEVKKDKQGGYKASKEQEIWINNVNKMGGIGAVIDNPVDFERLINNTKGER